MRSKCDLMYLLCIAFFWFAYTPFFVYCINLLCFSVEGEPHEKAVELLKAARSSVKLVVR